MTVRMYPIKAPAAFSAAVFLRFIKFRAGSKPELHHGQLTVSVSADGASFTLLDLDDRERITIVLNEKSWEDFKREVGTGFIRAMGQHLFKGDKL